MKLSVLRDAIEGKASFTKDEIIPYLIDNGYYDSEDIKKALDHYYDQKFQQGLRSLRKGGHREVVSTEVETPDGEIERRWYQPQLCDRPQLEYLRRYAIHQADYWMREANYYTGIINLRFGGQMPLPYPDSEAA